MKKKILALCVVISLVVVAIIGGTLAYFTDNDAETNTFTVGSVEIDLIESQYHRVNAGKGYTTEREPIIGGYLWAANADLQGNFENTPDAVNSGWTSSFFSDDQIKDDAETYKNDYFTKKAANIVPGRNIRKNPYVVNTGDNDAYIRVRALIPVDLYKVIDTGLSYWSTTPLNSGHITSKAVDYYNNNRGEMSDAFKVTRDGKNYYEFDFTYTQKLAPGAVTFWNAWGNIAINKYATQEDLKDIDSFNVIFEADAIQADGFDNGQDAFVEFDTVQNS